MSTRNALWTAGYSGAFAEDFIRFRAMADSSGNLKVPTAGYSHTGSQNCGYNWRINYDNREYVQYVGTGGTGSNKCITIATGLEANSEHIVELRTYDILNNYGWALAFGWYNSSIADRLLEIIVDSTYLGFAINGTSTGNYFRYAQYRGCTNLRNAYEEYLPSTVLDTGTNFRCYQYAGCSSLLIPGTESAPNSITEIKDNFRMHQYDGCSSLTNSSVEVMPNTVTYIGGYFRGYQYYNCKNITTAAAEVLPPNLTTIYIQFRCYQYSGCSNLVTVSDEVMPNTVTRISDQFRLGQFMNCPKITHNAKEAVSENLRYGGSWFHYRHSQYENCTNITRLDVKSMPAEFGSHEYCRADWLRNCGNSTNKMIIYVTGPIVEYGTASFQLNGNNVDKVYVPDELVQGYKNNSFWSSVSSKIVGYNS